MRRVYRISKYGETVPLHPVRCTDESRELQDLLAANLDLLPGDQIHPDDPLRWALVKREMPVPDPGTGQPRWSIDFLLVDQHARPTFVEVKRTSNSEARRTIVGQVLEYAANGHHYWGAEELRDLAEASARSQGRSISEVLTELTHEPEPGADAFFDQVESNLREGQVRLVFFLEEGPQELRSIVDFMNRQMERAEVLLVEARLYETDGMRIVVPSLFGFTEEARQVKKTVTVQAGSTRRKWTMPEYLEALEQQRPDAAGPIRRLLSALEGRFELRPGTGKTGSINLALPTLIPRSLVSLWTDGSLTFSFGWLDGSPEADDVRERLRRTALDSMQLELPADKGFPVLKAEQWISKADTLARFLVGLQADASNPEETTS